MARPKLHEREETLRKALSFFWKNGFSGSSVRELGQALDLHPGSIYSAFGSKEGLCLEAIELYGRESQKRWDTCMEGSEFFTGLSKYIAGSASDDEHPATCFLVKTFSSQLKGDEKLVERARELVGIFRKRLVARIARAIKEGEVREDVDVESFATLIQTQIMGLRCFLDSNPDEETVGRALGDIVELLRLAAAPNA